MALFKPRRAASPQTAVPDDRWSVGQATVDGKPLIVRWDRTAAASCPDPTRPVKVTFGVQVDRPQRNGLPSPRDLALLDSMEEALFSELPELADSQPVLVLTTNGMREWIVYAGRHDWLKVWAPTFERRFLRGRPGKIEAVADPTWETFLHWTST